MEEERHCMESGLNLLGPSDGERKSVPFRVGELRVAKQMQASLLLCNLSQPRLGSSRQLTHPATSTTNITTTNVNIAFIFTNTTTSGSIRLRQHQQGRYSISGPSSPAYVHPRTCKPTTTPTMSLYHSATPSPPTHCGTSFTTARSPPPKRKRTADPPSEIPETPWRAAATDSSGHNHGEKLAGHFRELQLEGVEAEAAGMMEGVVTSPAVKRQRKPTFKREETTVPRQAKRRLRSPPPPQEDDEEDENQGMAPKELSPVDEDELSSDPDQYGIAYVPTPSQRYARSQKRQQQVSSRCTYPPHVGYAGLGGLLMECRSRTTRRASRRRHGKSGQRSVEGNEARRGVRRRTRRMGQRGKRQCTFDLKRPRPRQRRERRERHPV